jgi:uncharacterized protein (DUF1684 family)
MRQTRTLIIIALVLLICASVLYQIFSENSERRYIDELIKMRAEKDLFFKNDPQSPIEDRASFTKLNYFDPNLDLRLPAEFIPLTESQGIEMIKMTDGLSEPYIKAGRVLFSIKNEKIELEAFRPGNQDESELLFIPFFDNTNDSLTYGGGRYLEIDLNQKPLLIDFNLCYQPYCAYNKKYVCPVPPTSNRLNIPITAGEMMRSAEQ